MLPLLECGAQKFQLSEKKFEQKTRDEMESEATEMKIYSTEFFYPKEFRILFVIGKKCIFTFLLVFESNTFFL